MSFLEDFKDATIGFSGYPRLLSRPTGGFGYMALLLLIVMTISGAIGTYRAKTDFAWAAGEIERGPDFSLTGGEVHFSGPMPFQIELDGQNVIIVDTTGQTTPEALKSAGPRSMLITKNTLYQSQGFGQIRSTDLSTIPFSVTKADVIAFIAAFHWIVAIVYVFIYVAQVGFKALDACILGLIATAYGSSLKQPVSFELGFKAGLYAMSLPTVIQWLFPGFSSFTLFGFAVFWGISILYLLMGLKSHFEEPPGIQEI